MYIVPQYHVQIDTRLHFLFVVGARGSLVLYIPSLRALPSGLTKGSAEPPSQKCQNNPAWVAVILHASIQTARRSVNEIGKHCKKLEVDLIPKMSSQLQSGSSSWWPTSMCYSLGVATFLVQSKSPAKHELVKLILQLRQIGLELWKYSCTIIESG